MEFLEFLSGEKSSVKKIGERKLKFSFPSKKEKVPKLGHKQKLKFRTRILLTNRGFRTVAVRAQNPWRQELAENVCMHMYIYICVYIELIYLYMYCKYI